jgi:hypothetical protein
MITVDLGRKRQIQPFENAEGITPAEIAVTIIPCGWQSLV